MSVLTSSQPSRIARRQKCFLCDLPKSSWTILNDFSQPVCRGCVNYEGLDRVEDAICESKRLRELEGTGLGVANGGVTSVGCTVTATPTNLTTCASLDSTALPQVDSSSRSQPLTHAGTGPPGPRYEPATPQSADAVDFSLGPNDLAPGIGSGPLTGNSIVCSSAAGGNVVTNPTVPTSARADSSAPGGFDDFPSPLTPYSPDWGAAGRGGAYGTGMRVMDTGGYGPYNPLVAQDYMRTNPYAGYISSAHDSAFTYYGGWRAMKRSGPEDTMFNTYPSLASNRPGSIPPRRMSEPSPAAKRPDKGGSNSVPKSPGVTSANTPGAGRRSLDLSADHVITIPSSPVVAKPKDKTATSSAATEKQSSSVSSPGERKDSSATPLPVSSAASASQSKKATSKGSSPDSISSNTNDRTDSTASAATAAPVNGEASALKGDTPTLDGSKAGSGSQSSSGGAGNDTNQDSLSTGSSSSQTNGTASKPQQSQTPATPSTTDVSGSQKSCNHCGCGLASVQYVQCPSVERHRYCLFCTYMHIEWSDQGAVSCPSKQRCLHPTSNVPWVFLPNEIESIRKAVQLSETPAIMQ